MILKSLYLNNFRNYDELEINFHDHINVIYGSNGNGKTNLVEAIIYLSNLKSFRGVSDNNLIKFNKENFIIKSLIELQNENKKLKVTFVDNKTI
jgi:DNA replication and repair protein RecF